MLVSSGTPLPVRRLLTFWAVVALDVQNTFCIPEYEQYVAERMVTGAVVDYRRLYDFIYRKLVSIIEFIPTMDKYQAMQILDALYLVNDKGEHPAPLTLVTADDVRKGAWKFNAALSHGLEVDPDYGRRQLTHYTNTLKRSGKYELTVWPYHAMLGGIGHALVAAVEETIFFHGIARCSRPDFHVKGDNPFTEHYSVIGPEVREGPDGTPIAGKSDKFLRKLEQFDAVVIAGEAKSHCVAWTVSDTKIVDHVCNGGTSRYGAARRCSAAVATTTRTTAVAVIGTPRGTRTSSRSSVSDEAETDPERQGGTPGCPPEEISGCGSALVGSCGRCPRGPATRCLYTGRR